MMIIINALHMLSVSLLLINSFKLYFTYVIDGDLTGFVSVITVFTSTVFFIIANRTHTKKRKKA